MKFFRTRIQITLLSVFAVFNFLFLPPPGAMAQSQSSGISPEKSADYIHAVIETNRTVYSQYIVDRLKETNSLDATENWKEDNTLLLPAQFLRISSEQIRLRDSGVNYRLMSLWPINPNNGPKTAHEKKGLKEVSGQTSKPYTWILETDRRKEFHAIYPDRAVTKSCVTCHNNHPKNARHDFKQGDVMGGIHISFPVSKAFENSKGQFYRVAPEVLVDYIHSILEADRTVYAKYIVNRLQKKNVIYPTENWWEENTLLLPAQFLLNASDLIRNMRLGLDYRLISLWPINRHNGPANEFERTGLETVAGNPLRPYIGTTRVGDKNYFQAIYPDLAVTPACVACHNGHPKSPKHDFKLYDVLGGIVVSLQLN